MIKEILIIFVLTCATSLAFKLKKNEDLFYHSRVKRQAPLGKEESFFDKNSEVQLSEGRSQKIYPTRTVLDGAPESPERLRIRSDGNSLANEGRVEIYNEKTKRWGLVCDDYWNMPDAHVTCRQLGFVKAAREATRGDHQGKGNWTDNDYIIDKIKCQGSESSIFDCSHQMSSTCSGGSSGVSCLYNSGCPYGWLSFNGACYRVVNKNLAYKDAEEYCEKIDSKLAYILDRAENNFLSNVLYLQFKKMQQVWTGGYYAEIKMDSGKIEKRWNWYSTIHNVDQWNTSNLWFQGYGEIKSDKRPIGDPKIKSCVALNRLFADSQRSSQIYDVNYFWWDNLSCKSKLPFICQKIIPRGRTECYEGNGSGYRGTVSRTNQGTKCAKWSNPDLTVNSNTHPSAGLGDHNYCRNPDGDIMPWCWVHENLGIYGYCPMEKCSEVVIIPSQTIKPPVLDPPGKGKGGCAENQFHCPSMTSYNRKCLALSRVCDQVTDCSGLEDEDPKLCKDFFCKDNEFYCKADTFCILKANICDGQRHCSDGADEKNCTIISETEILEKFNKFESKILVVSDKVNYANLPLEKCIEKCRIIYPQYACRSVNYLPPNETRIFSECHLMKLMQSDIPNNLTAISYSGNHYSLKLDCSDKFKCSSGMCISKDKACDTRNDCGDNSDEIECSSVTFPPFEIRLTGSKNDWEGKVEIRYQGEWGYVCDDKFSIQETHVICKQLGFVEGLEFVHGAGVRFGKVRNPLILLDELRCKGTEFSIEECSHDPWRKHNCKSEEIAGVVCKIDRACMNTEFRCQKDKTCIKMSQICNKIQDCSDGSDEPEGKCFLSAKLVDGPDFNSGRIEIKGAFFKGTVCDDGFTDNEANVICRMLGIPGRASAVIDSRFGPGKGEIVLSNLQCNGNETSLFNCNNFKWGEHKCSHKEDAGVICGLPSLEPITTTTMVSVKKSEQIPGVTCGKKPITQKRGRVVGGFETIYGAFPWQVGVRHRMNDYDIHWCGGSILSEDWILSAAHCYEKSKNRYIIRTGDWNNNEQDIYEQTFEIEELFINPKYQGPPTYDFDMAIIKIKRNNGIGIMFNDHVQPVCLSKPGMVPDFKTKCLVSGWGETQSETADKLLAAEVPLIKLERCNEFYKGRVTDRMQCAGYEHGGIDTCQGDSGGPLVCQVNGIYTIFGATSWGDGCAVPRSPGVYARTASMLDYVKEVTGFGVD